MNNLLSSKNEETIKQTSADFYTMTVYSKDILGLDYLRIKEFIMFDQDRKIFTKNKNNLGGFREILNYFVENKFKFTSGISISFLLIYKFRSILVVPIFFTNYYFIKKIISKNFSDEDNAIECCVCYHCEKNKQKANNLKTYQNYYKMISNIVEKNPNIKSIEDFKNEISKLI